MFRRHEVEGEFVVTSVVVHDLSDGKRTLRVGGRLTDGRDGRAVTVRRVVDVADDDPRPGDRIPATWRHGRARGHCIRYTAVYWWGAAIFAVGAILTALALPRGVIQPDPNETVAP